MNIRNFMIIIKSHYFKLKWFKTYYNHIYEGVALRSRHFYGPITYDADGLTTSNNADFINEPRFSRAYSLAAETKPWENFTLQWRVYMVCWFANLVKGLEGDFVECGVNTGAYSRAVIDYISFDTLHKTFYLFDTFEGLPEQQVTNLEKEAGITMYFGSYKNVYENVVKTFSPFNVKIIKGIVPESLVEFDGDKICYLSIDMNSSAPEIAAANYFWDKLVKGGVLILDDYGFPMHIYQKRAFDAFALEKGQEILCLPTGQGIIIKK